MAFSTRVIWRYNLYTEKWRNYVIPNTRNAPKSFQNAVAVTIFGTTYTFGGDDACPIDEMNELWTLETTKRGGFTWSHIKPQCKEQSPSPRSSHTGWEYEGKLWIFGGLGPSPEGYLYYSGDIVSITPSLKLNNQLLCYNPNTQKWTNPQCFGNVPSPRSSHATTVIKKQVWLYGGRDAGQHINDIFELTMHSLTWTQIHPIQPHPQANHACTLTAVADQLVLHGGCNRVGQYVGDTWIMDLQSHSWRLHTSGKDHSRGRHTVSSGLNSSVIILGGDKDFFDQQYNTIFHVTLEPKPLQQLAIQIIHKHQAALPLEFLPVKLTSLLKTSVKCLA